MKVLIADADQDVIKNFYTYTKSSFPQIKNICAQSDMGKDITETVKVEKPDLIIADIRFFGLSSVQKIRGLYEQNPDLRFILYGTYNDAEYMRKSMEFGGIDFMYRPVKPADFHRCLENALNYFQKLEEKKKREAAVIQSYKGKKYLFEEVFLKSLIQGHIKNETEIYYTFKYFGLDLKPGFTVFIVHVDHFKKLILTLDEMEKHLLTYNILLAIERTLQGKKAKAFIGSFSEVVVILSGEYQSEQVVALCDDIRQTVFLDANIRVTIGIGRTYENPTQIFISYREAQGALRYRFQMGYHTVIHILFAEPLNIITYRYPAEREARLIQTAAIGEYDYTVELLREIFDALKECEPLPAMYLSKVMMNLLISINRYLGEQNIKIQSPFTSFFPSREILELGEDIEEAFDYMRRALKSFCEHIVFSRTENDKALVQSTKAYIKEKFYETFSLAKIATEMGTTPEYLSKLFADEEGLSAFDYALNIRMEEAKHLLLTTNMDDNLIAVKVGYDDGRHFRSTFKKLEGMSTNEFRAKHKPQTPTVLKPASRARTGARTKP